MDNNDHSQIEFPPLPIDIFREIVEFASYSSRPTALALTLVSSATRSWSLSAIYETVLLRSVAAVKQFQFSVRSSSRPNSRLAVRFPVARRVKHLGIMALGPINLVQDIITQCSNLESLACGIPFPQQTATTRQYTQSPTKPVVERHLLGISCRDGIPFSALSPHVTHLHVQLASCQALSSLSDLHDHLPDLTYLALSLPTKALTGFHSLRSVIDHMLEHNSHLVLILVQITDLSNEGFCMWSRDLTSELDIRVVVRRAPKSAVEQWRSACMSTHQGFWTEATEEIRKRRDHQQLKKNLLGQYIINRHSTRNY
ncbi:hypothetical protein Moror_6343 [Moniliophthora roreri MCA 2997]|uniref:F-box domain-containing protein n=1 Tax=Moniliophthora roreri (strain MCA 2997) TaxID=1381753 RepID=V2XTN9_MONRO|nr:hypothetical protein Moror_6343 [Moniliophthora roreri MCA 2997]